VLFSCCADFGGVQADEVLKERIAQADKIVGVGRILPAAQSGLGAEGRAVFLVGDDLRRGLWRRGSASLESS
jgi:hypothetical protein